MKAMLLVYLLTTLCILTSESAVIKGSNEPKVPAECLSAKNITESWRLNHDKNEREISGCDMSKELDWFRFTGAAG